MRQKDTPFDDFRMAEHRCSFVSTGGTTVHWHSEKASIQSLFLPHTLAERETSDLSLLYYPDAQAPLGNEILYYEHHAMPLSAQLKTNGEIAAAPLPPLHYVEPVVERDARGHDGYLVCKARPCICHSWGPDQHFNYVSNTNNLKQVVELNM